MATTQNIVTVGYTHSDNVEQVDASLVTGAGESAQETGRVLAGSKDQGYASEWSEPATLPDGRKCHRMYLFTNEEIEAAGEDASNLPWDDEHVSRIILRD